MEGHTLKALLRAFLAPAEKKTTMGSCGEGLGDKRLTKRPLSQRCFSRINTSRCQLPSNQCALVVASTHSW